MVPQNGYQRQIKTKQGQYIQKLIKLHKIKDTDLKKL